MVLDGIYCNLDGTCIAALEFLKKTAAEILTTLKEKDSKVDAEDVFSALNLKASHGEGPLDLLGKALAGLEEDVASFRRVSRVPEHDRGNCRHIIKSGISF